MSSFEDAFVDKGMWPHPGEAIAWVSEVFEPHFIRFLDDVIRRRQDMIASDYLQMALSHIRIVHKTTSGAVVHRVAYLDLVECYHVGSKKKLATPDDWTELGQRFLQLEGVTPVVAFYRLNYAFLCVRNGDGAHDFLTELYRDAVQAAAGLEETERDEALGHLHYNWARYLLKVGRRNEALAPWQESSKHRVAYYDALKRGRAGESMLLAAAQQVAKNLHEFRDKNFFQEVDTVLCGVPQELFDSLEQMFGIGRLLHNCVNKPK
jgi:hypothetical protein